MDFAEAIDFSKKFSSFNPKVFIGFSEWGIWHNETGGYVVLTDVDSNRQLHFNQLIKYVKGHNLRVDHVKDFLMISTLV